MTQFSIHPEAASMEDIERMAAELVALWMLIDSQPERVGMGCCQWGQDEVRIGEKATCE